MCLFRTHRCKFLLVLTAQITDRNEAERDFGMWRNVEGAVHFTAGEAQRAKHEAKILYVSKKLEKK